MQRPSYTYLVTNMHLIFITHIHAHMPTYIYTYSHSVSFSKHFFPLHHCWLHRLGKLIIKLKMEHKACSEGLWHTHTHTHANIQTRSHTNTYTNHRHKLSICFKVGTTAGSLTQTRTQHRVCLKYATQAGFVSHMQADSKYRYTNHTHQHLSFFSVTHSVNI